MPEFGVQERVLESGGVAVAPSSEAVCVVEVDGLHGAHAPPGKFISFDIEASCKTLEEEMHFSVAAARAQHAHAVRDGRWWVGRQCRRRWVMCGRGHPECASHGAAPGKLKLTCAGQPTFERFDAFDAATLVASAS